MKLFTIEGNTQFLDGGAMFGHAPKELWKKWLPADEKNRIQFSCRSLLLEDYYGKNILFDVGVGVFFPPEKRKRFGVKGDQHMLLKNLEKTGLTEESIDAIVLSHLHFDHVGGLLPTYGEPDRILFPNARIYIGQEHWEYVQHPHQREQASFIPKLHELLKKTKRLNLIKGPSHQDLPNITFRLSHGHTIGLLISEIHLQKKLVVFISDLIPGMPWVHLPITMGYDRFPEKTVDEKKELLQEYLDKKATLVFVHDPNVACAEVIQERGKYRGVPVEL